MHIKRILQSIIIIAITLTPALIFAQETSDSEDSKELIAIIYVEDNCEICDQFVLDITKETVDSIAYADVRNTKNEVVAAEYELAKQACELTDDLYPLMITEDVCFSDTSKAISSIEGLIAKAVDSYSQEGETSTTITENEDNSDKTLSEYLNGTQRQADMDPILFIAMLIAPAIFIGLGIYMIRKFKF